MVHPQDAPRVREVEARERGSVSKLASFFDHVDNYRGHSSQGMRQLMNV